MNILKMLEKTLNSEAEQKYFANNKPFNPIASPQQTLREKEKRNFRFKKKKTTFIQKI